jgi:hypothetical protein
MIISAGYTSSRASGRRLTHSKTNTLRNGKISGSHGSEYEDVFWAVAVCSLVEIARHLGALKMKAVTTSETSDNFYRTTQCSIPEDSHLQVRK